MRGTTIIEYRSFPTTAARFLSTDEMSGLVDYLCENPKAGKEISSVRGLRLLPWPLSELGQIPSTTVGYYYLDSRSPVHLIGCFCRDAKNPASSALELAFEENSS